MSVFALSQSHYKRLTTSKPAKFLRLHTHGANTDTHFAIPFPFLLESILLQKTCVYYMEHTKELACRLQVNLSNYMHLQKRDTYIHKALTYQNVSKLTVTWYFCEYQQWYHTSVRHQASTETTCCKEFVPLLCITLRWTLDLYRDHAKTYELQKFLL